MSTTPKRSRARTLMQKLIESGVFSETALATQLLVNSRKLRRYLDGADDVPLPTQICLAAILIDLGEKWASAGYGLRGQIEAAIRFDARGSATRTERSKLHGQVAPEAERLRDSL